jgi:hypothetical protein
MLLNLVVVDGVLFVIRSFSVCLSDTGAWVLDFCCYQDESGFGSNYLFKMIIRHVHSHILVHLFKLFKCVTSHKSVIWSYVHWGIANL